VPEVTDRRAVAAILACSLLAYAAALCGTFVYDDVHTVRDNPAIRSLANLPRFFVDLDAFSAIDCRMYRPVVLASYAVDWQLGRGAAWPFKLTNVALHAGVALALFRLGVRLGCRRAAALFAACAFAAHPLASEAVNTASGRSELGVALGVLLGLHAHLSAVGRPARAGLTAACALLACGSKEIGVLLPAVLLVLDPPRLRDRRTWVPWLVRHAPPALAVLAYLLVRRWLFGCATAELPRLSGGSEPMAGHGRDLLTQLCTMATLLPRALAQCVLPVGLSLDPPVTFATSLSPRALAGFGFVAGCTWLGLRRAGAARRLGLALAWAAALPWFVLALNLPYLEHRMYLPLAGLGLWLAGTSGAAAAAPRALPGQRLAAGAVLSTFAALAAVRSLEYRDAAGMWSRVVRDQPGSVRGLCGLAACHIERGDAASALPLVQRAVAAWPRHAAALRNLAELELKLHPAPGNAMAALVAADRLIEMAPHDPFDRLLRSRALALAADATGETSWYGAAEAEALHCLAIAPPKSLVYRTAASAWTRAGDHERALALLDAAVAAGLVNAPLLLDRADCLLRLGRGAEAEADLRRAVREHPFDPAVLARLMHRAAPP
jgi:tetratricopeptide (TPR) repeat protein